MILLKQQPEPQAPEHAAPPGEEVWGLDARGLHRAYWASRRVQVVGRGEGAAVEGGATLYLLLEADDLVAFDLRPALKRLQWTAARVARLRLVSRDTQQDYRERVRFDERGRFRAVERLYGPRARSTCRAFLTPDAAVARAWSAARSRHAAIGSLRRRTPREKLVSLRLEGEIADAGDAGDRQDFVRGLMGRWSRIGAVADGVYEYAPGVWLHETAQVGEGARLLAPVWVGAGVSLPPGEVVVGPAVLCDEVPIAAGGLGEVDWGALAMPGRRRVPSLTRKALRRCSKRGFDVAFSLCVLLATLPLYPAIMLLIWLEDGRPFLFAHTRQTMHGRPFPCLKFRTMCKDAEKIKAQIMQQNEADGPQFFLRRDPRVLKVGAFLRRYQLDELPQFLNVLAGHMSVVGPRPSPDRENQYCPAWREMRLGVRPGVTGLWQVRRTREPETDFQEWIRYDLEYVRNQSWRLDIWIIVQTLSRMIRG